MKSEVIKKLSIAAMSVVLFVSGLGLTAQASGDHVCTNFHVRYEFEYSFLNPSQHWVDVIECETCDECRHKNIHVVDSYLEGHNYILDYENNVLTCSGCGDSYGYTR